MFRTLRRGLLLILAGNCVLAAEQNPTNTSASWHAYAWQVDKGLPDNTVTGVAQTSDGYLWVATETGLARFDGVRFKEVPAVDSAGENTSLIYGITTDRKGRLWLAKDRGAVVCMDGARVSALTSQNGLRAKEVRTILEDNEGAIWVSYIGSEVVRIQGTQARAFTGDDGLPDGNTCQLTTDVTGKLWFARGTHVGVFREGKFVSLRSMMVQRIAAARNGGVWICYADRISRFVEGGQVVSVATLPATRPNPTAILEDREGGLWIGTRESGLFYYDGSKITPVQTSHHEILSLNEDREGNIWAGTRGGGLNRLQRRRLEMVDVGSSIRFEGVRSVCQDKSGDIWAVTQSGGLTRNHEGVWQRISTNEGWHVLNSLCVTPAPGGGVWVGTQYRGIHLWRQGVAGYFDINTKEALVDNAVGSLFTAASGDIWIGAASTNALQRLRNGALTNFTLPANSGLVNALAEDGSSNVWVAMSSGKLLRINEDDVVNETAKLGTAFRPIRCLCATPSGLWIGFEGGCAGRLSNGRYTPFSTEQGFRDEYIFQIVRDKRGKIWFAGNRSLSNAREADLEAVAAGGARRVDTVAFGNEDGLPSLQVSHAFWPGALCDREGKVWIPTLAGLIKASADGPQKKLLPPHVVIERVTVDRNVVAAYQQAAERGSTNVVPLDLTSGSRLQLAPDHRQVEIEFTAPSFKSPKNVGFKYKLEPFDAEWVDAGDRRMANYTRIAPGDYVFRVTACNEQGVWDEKGASFELKVLPHLWDRWWFRISSMIVILAGVGGVVRYIEIRKMQRKVEMAARASAIERERARIAQDLHDDLGAGLTQISLNSALVQNPSVPANEAGGMLQEIDQRARELVTALDEIVWAVNPKNDTVPSLARYLCQYAQTSLQPADMACRLEVAPTLGDFPLGAEQRHNLFLAFKEALHNAMRHSGARELNIKIDTEGDSLVVMLADNGRGFVPGNAADGADGLQNMQTRLQRLGGTCEVTSVPGQGVKIIFRLPLATYST